MNAFSIELKNYRNLKKQTIHPEQGVNLIFGDNAQGKTNLLEAIWIGTGGRSFRGIKDSNLIAFCKDDSEVFLYFFSKKREQKIKTKLSKEKREMFLNSIPQNPLSKVVGVFCATVFSPNHLYLIKGGPTERRRFLDTAICQIKPLYAKLLLKYKHILFQRNALLKNIAQNKKSLDVLGVWDEKLIEHSTLIRRQRMQYIGVLQKTIEKIYPGILKNKERLSFVYNFKATGGLEEDDIRGEVQKELNNNIDEDIFRGFTQKGPHRDDFEVLMNQKPIRFFGSQGQQRSTILSIKIAESFILGELTGERPVVLLDDVMSELDHSRQKHILNHIKNFQVFITCCDKNSIAGSIDENTKLFAIKNGVVFS
ncbi:MAG: DNA replication/repair protein RecF [Oscillospiraceae bacterium]|nr:DNA replication/repair protein RecF [Oscillospiraceae bacterium]